MNLVEERNPGLYDVRVFRVYVAPSKCELSRYSTQNPGFTKFRASVSPLFMIMIIVIHFFRVHCTMVLASCVILIYK